MSEYIVKLEGVGTSNGSQGSGEKKAESKIIEDDYPEGDGKKAKLIIDGSNNPVQYILFHTSSSQAKYVVHFNRRNGQQTFDIKKYNAMGEARPFTINQGSTSFSAIIGVRLDKFGEKIFAKDIPTYSSKHEHDRETIFDTARFAQHIQAIQMKMSMQSAALAVMSNAETEDAKTHYVELGGVQWPIIITSSALGGPEKIEQRRPDGVLMRTIECKNGMPNRIIMHADNTKAHPHLIVELDDQQQLQKISFIEKNGSTIEEEGVFSEGNVVLTSFVIGRPKATRTALVSNLYSENIGKLLKLAAAVMPIEGLHLQLPQCPGNAEVLDLYETGRLRAFKRFDSSSLTEVWQNKLNGSLFTYTAYTPNKTMIESESSVNVLEARLLMREPGSVPETFTTFYPTFNKPGEPNPKTLIKYGVGFNVDETGSLKSFTVFELDKAGNTINASAKVPIEQWGDKVANLKIDTAPLKEKMEAIQKPYPLPQKNTSRPALEKDVVKVVAADPESFPDQEEIKNEHGGGEIRYFWKGAVSKEGNPVPRCMLRYNSTPFAEWNSHIHLVAITKEEVSVGGAKLLKARDFVRDQLRDDLCEILPHHGQDVIIDFAFVDRFDPAYAEAIQTAKNVLQEMGDSRKVLISGINGREDNVREQLIEGLNRLLGDGIESTIQPEHLNARNPDSEYYFLALTRREDYDENGRKNYSEDYRLGKITGYREHDPTSGKPIQSKKPKPRPLVTTVLRVGDQVSSHESSQGIGVQGIKQVAVRGKDSGRKQSKHNRLALQ